LQSQSCRCAFSVSAELTPARLAEVAEIHRRRQASLRARARRRSSIFENPAEAAILRELLEWAARNGRSRHYWLDVDGRLAAFVLCFHRGATLFPYLMAFDPAYEPFAPTKHLYLYLFEHEADLCATRTVNLLPGLNLLKRQFATQTVGHLRWSATNRRRLASRLRCRWTRLARALKANVVGPLASRLAGAPAIAAQRPLGRG
jgi:CelD/BcsL family acetyltransferase involved in cellulose biosynthesis